LGAAVGSNRKPKALRVIGPGGSWWVPSKDDSWVVIFCAASRSCAFLSPLMRPLSSVRQPEPT